MQIVIDIPEEEYQNYLKMRPAYPEGVFCYIKAIQNGTPLPKGHGRIADMDAAIKCIEEVEGEDAIWAISLIEWACSKRIVIEADKESKDKE